jgi:hypothetical protein
MRLAPKPQTGVFQTNFREQYYDKNRKKKYFLKLRSKTPNICRKMAGIFFPGSWQ